jgi:heptosyltransferase-2
MAARNRSGRGSEEPVVSRSKLKVEGIQRVVVRGTNWVGDAVMMIPALRQLRRVLPEAHITLATRSWSHGIFADADFIDDLLPFDRRGGSLSTVLKHATSWRRRRFDLGVLFQNAFEAAAVAALARIPARVGYATDARGFLLTHPFNTPTWRSVKHEVFYYLNIVSELETCLYGETSVPGYEPVFDLKVSERRRQEARDRLKRAGIVSDRPLIALCPGSTNSRAKRWPAERFAALGDLFIDTLDANVILIGAADELQISREVAAGMKHRPVVLTGDTTLADAVAVLSEADALISNDTGPAHIAAALEKPTIVIFGPTDPTTTGPYTKNSVVVRRPPDCAPCMLRDCPIDHRCMTAIGPAEVFEQTVSLMERTKNALRNVEVHHL